MATGYTHPVKDGEITTVSEFAAVCARAFGAFSHQRDASIEEGLRYPEDPRGTGYHFTSLLDAQRKLSVWNDSMEEGKYRMWSEYYLKALAFYHNYRASAVIAQARYTSMQIQVEAISVPAELGDFKQFMLDQLRSSIEFDCPLNSLDHLKPQEYVQWIEATTQSRERDVEYYHEEYDKEVKRYEDNVRFINNMTTTFGFKVEK